MSALTNYKAAVADAGYEFEDDIALVIEHDMKFLVVYEDTNTDGYGIGYFYKGDCTKSGDFGSRPLWEGETLEGALEFLNKEWKA